MFRGVILGLRIQEDMYACGSLLPFFFEHQLLFPFLFNRFVVESLLCLFSLAPFRHTGPILSLGNTVLS